MATSGTVEPSMTTLIRPGKRNEHERTREVLTQEVEVLDVGAVIRAINFPKEAPGA